MNSSFQSLKKRILCKEQGPLAGMLPNLKLVHKGLPYEVPLLECDGPSQCPIKIGSQFMFLA